LIAADETALGGYSVRYGLREWDSANAIRALVSYTPEAEAAAAAVQHDEAEKIRLRSRILWLLPLAGLAPGSVQDQWGDLTGLSMGWISAGSALILMGVALTLSAVTEGTIVRPVAFYLAVESFVRLLLTAVFRRPWGSPLVALPYHLWQIVTHRKTKPFRERASTLPSVMTDEIIRRAGEKGLRVRSPFYDSDLAGDAPVRIEGAFYQVRRWHKEGKGLQRRWLYELEEMDAAPSGRWHEFIRPRQPARQKVVEEYTHAYDLANSFALFWGFYPRSDQSRLHRLYEFDAPKSTTTSAGILLIVGLLQTGLAVTYHLSAVVIASSTYIIFESVYRLYRALMLHQAAGSIMGYIFRLVIRPPQ